MSAKCRATKPRSNEAGLTLIECLVAIAVIGITTASIGPMMVFSVATRVQNQRTEQALQLAQAEIDKVRLTVEQGGDYGQRLQNISLFRIPSNSSTPATVPAPMSFIASTASVTSTDQARRVDIDGDGTADFAIQIFRTRGIEVPARAGGTTPSTPVAFRMGVRVYDARANVGSLLTEQVSLSFTSGEGQRNRRPLAVLYSEIAQGDRDGALCQYWRFAGSTPTGLVCN